MISGKMNKSYVSSIDEFLTMLEETLPLSESQEKEIMKHARIMRLRDDPYFIEKEEII